MHVRENADEFKQLGERYSAHWTPTIIILGADGQEQYRIEGFLPTGDFLSQVALGIAHAAFKGQDYTNAERRFGVVVDRYGETEAAADAMYWRGVSKYRATNDASALKATAEGLRQRYPGSSWAKKASVWLR